MQQWKQVFVMENENYVKELISSTRGGVSVTRSGTLLDFGQLFKAFGKN